MQAVEAKQRQDEMAGFVGKPLKAKGGKMKKAQLPEVMPSPHGERVVPRITAEMKAEAEKKSKKKIKVTRNILLNLPLHPHQYSPKEMQAVS